MNSRNSLRVLERVGDIAMLAGFKGRIDGEHMHFALGIGLDDGRSQMVYVRDVSRSADRQIITVFSPCLVRKKGFWKGISKELAIRLLRRNEAVHFARYGICELEKADMIVASMDHLLETLDPPELEASVFHVALAADTLEREHGQDTF